MACMVDGCNFLLKAVAHEAFSYENSQMSFVDLDPVDTFPYLLVNIGDVGRETGQETSSRHPKHVAFAHAD